MREIETIVRDGTACACARVGVVTASRVAPVVETHAAGGRRRRFGLPNAAREQSRVTIGNVGEPRARSTRARAYVA